MSRSEFSWRRPTDPDDVAWQRGEHEVDRDFWEYVDSQAFGYRPSEPHEDSWEAERAVWCLALNSQRDRCGQQPLERVPFCAFHFDRAWARIEAFVGDERMAQVNRLGDWDRRRLYADAQIDVAMVRDAKRALAVQAERVYFFAAEHAVKVGRSIHPEKRVRTLRGTRAPDGIDLAGGTLLGTIPGGCNVESALHQRFHPHHLVGEWFQLEPIREQIAALIAESASQENAA